MKTDHFRRQFVEIGELDAHSLFENGPRTDGRVRLRPFCASGRVRFGASGFLNGAKVSHHSLRVVRWWCKGTHRAISPPSAVDFVDFVDFVVQRHTPRGNFPRFLWTWGTCALGDPVAPVFVTLGHFSPPPCAKPDALRTRPAATPFFASGRVRTRPDASGVRCGAQASHHTP